MNRALSEELSEWSFPSLEIITTHEQTQDSELLESIEEGVNEYTPHHITMSHQDLLEESKHLTRMNAEVESLKVDFEKKIDLLNNLINSIQKPSSIFDNELIALIQSIIKKAVKKIIHKELEADPKLIIDMINELKKLLHPRDSIVSISVSETDFKRLDLKDDDLAEMLNIDNTFSEGDLVIKSNFSEIHAKLSDRIAQVIGA